MGNEKSALNGLEIDEQPVEITDFWIQNSATARGYGARKLSIFISEPSLHYGASFGKPSPLERAAKNLMLHRHPCILRYVSSWSKGNKFFLATEEARPWIQAINTQNTLQICIGLYSILRALIFLHEKALASHNNVCGNSVYVTPEGSWKLGGLEYLCKFAEFTTSYFDKISRYRFHRGISPGEDAPALVASNNCPAIDAYAFGVFAEEVLQSKDPGDVPGLAEFREFCKENLQNSDSSSRSKLSNVLDHPFFTHDFLRIHTFLEELPLKNDVEKETFFENLVPQLRTFPENVVAEQLGRLLLSRIVLLDSTAQKKLLPFVLKPKVSEEKDEGEASLFSVPTFKTYLVPKLLDMFCIRDASIRLVLLSHFDSFVYTFQADELKARVLPELLVGIKDTNDRLVCATLRALADIVPILGAATVIGGNRGKLFTDGRPNKILESKETNGAVTAFPTIADFSGNSTSTTKVNLPERPSPDGGEDKEEADFTFAEKVWMWSDWDPPEGNGDNAPALGNRHQRDITAKPNNDDDDNDDDDVSRPSETPISRESATPTPPTPPTIDSSASLNANKTVETQLTKKTTLSDISELDIKNSRSMKSTKEEYDFFTDMEPVIKKTQVVHVQRSPVRSMFDVKAVNGGVDGGADGGIDGTEENNGWDEGLSDWGIDDAAAATTTITTATTTAATTAAVVIESPS